MKSLLASLINSPLILGMLLFGFVVRLVVFVMVLSLCGGFDASVPLALIS